MGHKKVRGEWFKNEAAMRTEKGAFCFLDEVVVDGYEEEMIERMIIIHKGEWLTDMQDPPPEEDVEDIPTMERGVVQEEYAKVRGAALLPMTSAWAVMSHVFLCLWEGEVLATPMTQPCNCM